MQVVGEQGRRLEIRMITPCIFDCIYYHCMFIMLISGHVGKQWSHLMIIRDDANSQRVDVKSVDECCLTRRLPRLESVMEGLPEAHSRTATYRITSGMGSV